MRIVLTASSLSELYDYIRSKMPPEVEKPTSYIKNAGPLQVEAKVWLANQRTFIKWQHISVLLASLSLGLFNSAGTHNKVAFWLAIVYTAIAVFAGVWGWWMYVTRSRLIRERSGKDFDNILGPMVVCIGLAAALCLNFGFKVCLSPSPIVEWVCSELTLIQFAAVKEKLGWAVLFGNVNGANMSQLAASSAQSMVVEL